MLPVSYRESRREGRLVLRDGSTASVRTARPEDADRLRNFFDRVLTSDVKDAPLLSGAEAGEGAEERDPVERLCDDGDPDRRRTLLVTRMVGGEDRIIAAASYEVREPGTAEIAMLVEGDFRGMGIGSLLLERLSLLAVTRGISQFLAFTHPDNERMLELFRSSGFPTQEQRQEGRVRVDLSVVPDRESVSRFEMRDRIATAASLRPFFQPDAVAVVGASRDPESLGFRVLEALVMNRFRGPVYPVNPKAKVVGSIRAYPSVREIPEPVDLAVIVVPKEVVLEAVRDCAERGVRALVVITAGFAEVDEEGRRLQEEMVRMVRDHGMRLVGPNCMGLLNTDEEVRMAATFAPIFPPAGRVAMCTQSGALGMGILALTRRLHLGLSTFVSIGNQADVAPNDLLQYWEEDPGTAVILLYLESFGNPRRFARIARRVSRSKPIVAVKGGRTSAGHRAAGSHTAALAASEVAVDALFRQTGVIRADTLEEMFDLASVLESQPLPAGRRVGIVTNAGGPGILCADACESGDLEIPELSGSLQDRLTEFLPPAASVANPVDMIASATPEQYRRAVEAVLQSGEVDALIVLSVPLGPTHTQEIIDRVCEGVAAARCGEDGAGATAPVLACMFVEGGERPDMVHRTDGGTERIPSFVFPEDAARALGKIADYAERRRRPLGLYVDFEELDDEAARKTCRQAIAERGPGWLSAGETREVLEAFGLPVARGGVARDPEEAVGLADEIGYPVAVKLASWSVVHKTEFGGVRLDLADGDRVREAFREIRDALEEAGRLDAMEGVVVQPMIDEGVEVMVGVTEDELFGSVVAFGLGGIHVEILGDVCFRVAPLTDRDAEEMVREIHGYRLLEGYRGHDPADVEAIQEVLLRVSRLVEELPEVGEMDLNPIFALPPGRGCRIVDARIRVAAGPTSGG